MKKLAVVLVLLFPAAGLAQLPPVIKYTIPGVVNAGGLNNTRFVSDLALTNPGSSSANVILSFVPEGSLDDIEVSLSGGKTIVWRNVLQQLWGGVETAGAVVAFKIVDPGLVSKISQYFGLLSGSDIFVG